MDKQLREAAAAMGRVGGKRRMQAMTAKQRKQFAEDGGRARTEALSRAERKRIAALGGKGRAAKLAERTVQPKTKRKAAIPMKKKNGKQEKGEKS